MRGFALVAAAAALALPMVAQAQDAAGDAAKGKQVFAKCQACHSVEAGTNKLGPSLHGVVGRVSGTLEGFKYSDAMKAANLTWDEATLDKYLANPKGLVPGTKMVFPGLPKEQDRLDVIAYLKEAGAS
ncbi:cytochrome c family protein [Mycobacterium sp. KBS0706]|uniref:c-type cytochrome n=1 Tax=Mycobacterium sp. KBS0706 TaxID=2578109 RepID=UPI00110FBB8F|nr:cytochrome c family protein [Mycobacterium sp. KBS0706]TSD84194.1 cytochrome c family protein [Mycobacterium sp. KBS0706]